ncbi:recombinase family protein, partial [Lactiplantibacillus plantarum]|uniref:recombinase family protein n=1 Tax=Lactiplantibacillus plantarum TaxID=1590 RepID=UPI0009B506EA
MKYGYARVSTTDQKLANQIELLKLAGAEKIFQEKFTGTTTERPEFQKLLRVLKTGDTLIVTRTQEGKLYAKQHDPSFREGRPK